MATMRAPHMRKREEIRARRRSLWVDEKWKFVMRSEERVGMRMTRRRMFIRARRERIREA